MRLFGFYADPTQTTGANYHSYLLSQPQRLLSQKPTNLKVHNLCETPSAVPQAFLNTLGLGLGFCLSLHREQSNPIDSERLRRDLRNQILRC
jgi:hypothetical protein